MNQKASRRDIVRVITTRLLEEPKQRGVWLQRLAAYMVAHNIIDQADVMVNDIAHELFVRSGLLTVEVVSARELSAELKQSITDLLQTATGAQSVVMHQSVDQALLGGFVARTADAELDASVRSKLMALSALS